jgi:hypothetical protein
LTSATNCTRRRTSKLSDPIRHEEAVRRHEIDSRVIRPPGEERLEQSRGRALADSDAAGDADDVRRLRFRGPQELRRRRVQPLGRCDSKVEKARQRQVDLDDLLHRDRVVQAAQPIDVFLRERQRRGFAQVRPLLA